MNRIAYTVICTIEKPDLADAWLDWITTGGHAQEVIRCGAESAQVIRREDAENGTTFEVRYIFKNRPAFDDYIRDHAPRLRAEGLKLFPPEQGLSYSRSVGEIVGEKP